MQLWFKPRTQKKSAVTEVLLFVCPEWLASTVAVVCNTLYKSVSTKGASWSLMTKRQRNFEAKRLFAYYKSVWDLMCVKHMCITCTRHLNETLIGFSVPKRVKWKNLIIFFIDTTLQFTHVIFSLGLILGTRASCDVFFGCFIFFFPASLVKWSMSNQHYAHAHTHGHVLSHSGLTGIIKQYLTVLMSQF